jgi:hypothetical protein
LKKNASNIFITLILVVHIGVYLFKIDRDVYSYQKYACHPHQTYTEQPLYETVTSSGNIKVDYPQFSRSFIPQYQAVDHSFFWRSILFSYNSRVHHLLRYCEPSSSATITIVRTLCRQNICHKSSDDEEPAYRLFA